VVCVVCVWCVVGVGGWYVRHGYGVGPGQLNFKHNRLSNSVRIMQE